MKQLLFFCAFLYFPSPLITYQLTMTTVWGTPDPISVLFDNKSLEWEDCVQECFERANCAMVHQEKDSEVCKIYNYADIWRVVKDTADKVSIKVTMEEETCPDDPYTLFNDHQFESFVTTSTFNNFRIQTTDEDYTFFYNSEKLVDSYDDYWLLPETTCNYLNTMVFFYGSGASGSNGPQRVVTTTSWKECMFLCWDDPACFLANMEKGSDNCTMIDNGGVSMMTREETEEKGEKVAVKLTLTPNTCSLGYPEVLNNHRFTSPSGFSYPSFQIRVSSLQSMLGVNWIGDNNLISGVEPFEDGSPGGFMVYGVAGINYAYASVMCSSLGDDLMPIKSLEWLRNVSEVAYRSKKAQEQDDNVVYQFLIGLHKINDVWTWSTPSGSSLAVDVPDLMWADGNPQVDHECAWLVVTDVASIEGKTLQSANCSAPAMGMICHINLMEEGV